jgi:hypothetical protein
MAELSLPRVSVFLTVAGVDCLVAAYPISGQADQLRREMAGEGLVAADLFERCRVHLIYGGVGHNI